MLEERQSTSRLPSDRLVRTIRDRRVELQAMKLHRELKVAVQQLTAHDPPLPPEASFRVIADKSLPKELTAVTVIHGEPTQALVTWRLHTANGALHNRQLTRRLWPARGGWSGLLTTAATRVVLQAKD